MGQQVKHGLRGNHLQHILQEAPQKEQTDFISIKAGNLNCENSSIQERQNKDICMQISFPSRILANGSLLSASLMADRQQALLLSCSVLRNVYPEGRAMLLGTALTTVKNILGLHEGLSLSGNYSIHAVAGSVLSQNCCFRQSYPGEHILMLCSVVKTLQMFAIKWYCVGGSCYFTHLNLHVFRYPQKNLVFKSLWSQWDLCSLDTRNVFCY